MIPINQLSPNVILFNDTRKLISLEETKGVKYVGNNLSQKCFVCVKIDKHFANITACDYLLYDDCRSFFIELKGSDMEQAVQQIENSITCCSVNLTNRNVFGRIVLSRVNTTAIESTKIKNLKNRLKKLQGNLIYQSKQLTEPL